MKMRPALEEFLALSTMALATVNSDGLPHAAPVYFVAAWPGEAHSPKLYYFSQAGSRHSQDSIARPIIAAAIYPQVEDWQEIRGLQLRGKVRQVLRGDEWDHAWQAYRTKFPFVAALKTVVARNSFYVLEPVWVRLVDNRRAFGFKQEWSFDE